MNGEPNIKPIVSMVRCWVPCTCGNDSYKFEPQADTGHTCTCKLDRAVREVIETVAKCLNPS